MLKEIIIENFQPWKHLHLVLSEGYTALIGRSDKGKSAIIRAINWCINNRPTGFAFRRWKAQDEDVTMVTLIFDNGTVIREKNADIDQYRLQLPGKKEKVFKTLNRQVPDEIKNFFNLDFYNLKGQFDTFFLLQDSPGEVGRKFNEIVDLEIIDATLKSINSIVSEAKLEKEKLDKEKSRLQNELDGMSYLDTLKIEIDQFYFDLESFNKLEEKIEVIEGLLSDIYNLEDEISVYLKDLEFESEINSLIDEIKHIQIEKNRIKEVKELLDEINELNDEINELNSFYKYYSEIVNLIADIERYERKEEEMNEINAYLNVCNRLDRQIKEHEKALIFESEINSLITDMKQFQIQNEELYELEITLKQIKKYEKEIEENNKRIDLLVKEYENLIGEGVLCQSCGTFLNQEELRKRI